LPRNRAVRLHASEFTRRTHPRAIRAVRVPVRTPVARLCHLQRITSMSRRNVVAILAAMLLCGTALAHDYQVKSMQVSNPFARATPPAAKVAGAFMTIKNQGTEADRLVSASSPVASLVEIHEMTMDGGMMKMRAIKGIDVKPGATVELKPGSYHVMLEDLKQPLKQGEKIPLRLTFEKAGVVEVMVNVEAMGAAAQTH
jgi:periplasmic copper chaperone A